MWARLISAAALGSFLLVRLAVASIQVDSSEVIRALGVSTNAQLAEKLRPAVESFQRREYDQSLELLRKLVAENPSFPPASLMQAEMFVMTRQSAMALASLERAAVEDPKYPGIYVTFGQLSLAEGRLTSAALHFERALVLSERWERITVYARQFRTRSYSGLADVAERRGDWGSARVALEKWLELEPENTGARQRFAQALFRLDKHTDALNELKRASKEDGSLAPADTSMGMFWASISEVAKAEASFQYAVKYYPQNPMGHYRYAGWLLSQDRAKEAAEAALVAARLRPESPEIRALQGLIATYLKRPEEAERFFQALSQEAPAVFSYSNQLALSLADQAAPEKRARAMQLAAVNARTYSGSREALATLGWTYYRLGDLDEAERILRQAVTGTGVGGNAAYFLARVLVDRGDKETAEKLLKAALSAQGVFPSKKDAKKLLDKMTRN